MSKSRNILLPCPDCGKSIEFEYFDSVNVTLHPTLRKKVFTGELFDVKCPHCDFKSGFIHPLLYHDMDHSFMAQLDCSGNLLFFREQERKNPFSGMLGETLVGATTLGELVNVIICLERSLDWRAVLMTFLVMKEDFKKFCEQNKKHLNEVTYVGFDCEKNEPDSELIVAVEAMIEGKKERFTISFFQDAYEKILNDYKEIFDKVNPFIFSEYSIDHLLNNYEEHLDKIDKEKTLYYFVEVENQPMYLCGASEVDEYKDGDLVNITTKDNEKKKGTVVGSHEYNLLELEVPDSYFGIINDKCDVDNRKN